MYRKMDIAERAAKVADMAKQLNILEGLVDGPQAVAAAGGPTTADAAVFPILVFCKEARACVPLALGCGHDALLQRHVIWTFCMGSSCLLILCRYKDRQVLLPVSSKLKLGTL